MPADSLHSGRPFVSRDRTATHRRYGTRHLAPLKIEIVPTLIRFEGGREVRAHLWLGPQRRERLSGVAGLGRDLPQARPGCGAKNVEPGVIERLKVRFNETGLRSAPARDR